MAGKPSKINGIYYSRIYIRVSKKRVREKKVHLGTSNLLEAESRMVDVRQAESAIKLGRKISFPWQNDTHTIEIVKLGLHRAIKDFTNFKKADGIKPLSLERIKIALKHFEIILGQDFDVSGIKIDQIDLFKDYCNKIHSPNTINNNLSKIKALLIWLYDRDRIKSVPKIEKVRTRKQSPQYITDDEWDSLLNLQTVYRKHYDYEETIDEHWKRAFYFYRETGCRLAEPFKGKLEGNILIIDEENSKTNVQREIFVPNELISILKEMRNRVLESKSKSQRDCIQQYSKKFRYACDKLKIKKYFHCLRHTFAVRKYLETGNLYLVAKELGHSSIKTTEIYAKYNINRLEQDFYTLKSSKKLVVNHKNQVESYINHRTLLEASKAVIVGEV